MKKTTLTLLILSVILSLCPWIALAVELPELTFECISIESADAVSKNLSLSEQINGVSYIWSTSNWMVITQEGVVTRPMPGEEDAVVTLTATSPNGTKSFVVTVKAFQNIQEVLWKAKNELPFSVLSQENINEVTEDLFLPSRWHNNTYLYWSSSNENLLRIEGKTGIVKRPPFGEGLSCVILTAHIGFDNQNVTKHFLVRIKEQEIGRGYSRILREELDAFDQRFLSVQNLLAIRNDLILPKGSNSAVTVSFLSQNPEVLTHNGVVKRSHHTDETVNFLVKMEYGYEVTRLSYSMVIKALATDELTQRLEEDLEWLISNLECKHNLNRLTENLSLSPQGPNGSTFSYISSDTTVLSHSGQVQAGVSEKNVVLTVSSTLSGKSLSQSLSITIPRRNSYQSMEETSGGDVISGGSGQVLLKTEFDINPEVGPFYDVVDSHWAATAIGRLKEKEIVSGGDNGYFRPDDSLTREELVKMVVLAAGLSTRDEASFMDVPPSHWSYPYVASAYVSGIISGKGENLFGCGENVTRQDAAVILYNALQKMNFNFEHSAATEDFADAAHLAIYARVAVEEIKRIGLINGRENNEFKPLNHLTRSEAAVMIWRMLQL